MEKDLGSLNDHPKKVAKRARSFASKFPELKMRRKSLV